MSAPGLKITNFHYSHMAMPQLERTEWPKWVHMSGYASVVAQNAEEEKALLARPAIPGDVTIQLQSAVATAVAAPIAQAPVHTLVGKNDERDILIQIAREKGVKIDARWSTARIRKTLDEAPAQENQGS